MFIWDENLIVKKSEITIYLFKWIQLMPSLQLVIGSIYNYNYYMQYTL